MQYKVTGMINYVQSPIEHAWEDVARKYNLEIQPTQPVDLSKVEEGPILTREAKKAGFAMQYDRWLSLPNDSNDSHVYKKPFGNYQGVSIETLVQNINNPLCFREVIDFTDDSRKISEYTCTTTLFFDGTGELDHIDMDPEGENFYGLDKILQFHDIPLDTPRKGSVTLLGASEEDLKAYNDFVESLSEGGFEDYIPHLKKFMEAVENKDVNHFQFLDLFAGLFDLNAQHD